MPITKAPGEAFEESILRMFDISKIIKNQAAVIKSPINSFELYTKLLFY